MSTPVPHRDCVPSPGSVAVHRIPRSGLRVHRRRRIFRKVPRESLLQRNHYASWEYLVRIPKTRSHGNHYLSDSNWRKNPCAEYFGGKPSWMLFCTGNVFAKLFPVYSTYAILIQKAAKQTTILRNNDHKQRDNNQKPKSTAKTRSTKQKATATSKNKKQKQEFRKQRRLSMVT